LRRRDRHHPGGNVLTDAQSAPPYGVPTVGSDRVMDTRPALIPLISDIDGPFLTRTGGGYARVNRREPARPTPEFHASGQVLPATPDEAEARSGEFQEVTTATTTESVTETLRLRDFASRRAVVLRRAGHHGKRASL